MPPAILLLWREESAPSAVLELEKMQAMIRDTPV